MVSVETSGRLSLSCMQTRQYQKQQLLRSHKREGSGITQKLVTVFQS
uniref:Uncharacterized protein n=1 Tax=Arundo donax TaxID=35708 RepID=A0A0A9FVY8_ARUDO